MILDCKKLTELNWLSDQRWWTSRSPTSCHVTSIRCWTRGRQPLWASGWVMTRQPSTSWGTTQVNLLTPTFSLPSFWAKKQWLALIIANQGLGKPFSPVCLQISRFYLLRSSFWADSAPFWVHFSVTFGTKEKQDNSQGLKRIWLIVKTWRRYWVYLGPSSAQHRDSG